MKKPVLLFLFTLLPLLASAQIGTWRNYLSYYDIQQIQAAGDDIFVLASNGLYQYNQTDQSITTYDKVNGLNDTQISMIAWNKAARQLVIVYSTSNIDLLTVQGDVTNISDIYSKAITGDKTVYSITIDGQYAYLSCGFGIVKLNVKEVEISESYIFNYRVNRTAVSGGRIYAQTAQHGVISAPLTANLIDPSNWEPTTSYPAGIFAEDKTDYDTYYPVVSQLKPDGPKYNYFGFMKYINGQLYTTTYTKSTASRGGVQLLDDNRNWTFFQDSLEKVTDHNYLRTYSIDADPTDPSRAIVAARTGVYEFRDGKFVKDYNWDNSDGVIQVASTVGNGNKNYVMTTAGIFDTEGNFWCLNSVSPSTSIIELTHEGQWVSHHHDELMVYENRSFEEMRGLMFDSRGLLWFVNDFYRIPSLVRYDIHTDEIKVYEELVNQDGITYSPNYVHCVAEDRDGNIWIGTNIGAFYLPAANVTGDDATFYQFKVPRNDGSGYADYLMNGVNISTIAIDGAGRKWFGTNGNGVYLVSNDNLSQVYHFTASDSPLLSDNVESIACNMTTGEVFIGTDKGLCSYMSDATKPADDGDDSDVNVYPNPVSHDYTGLVTVTGLSFNADVKVLTASGTLVAEGRSNGGTYTWDVCDKDGRRVASGVYNIVTATSDGRKGVVCKVAVIH